MGAAIDCGEKNCITRGTTSGAKSHAEEREGGGGGHLGNEKIPIHYNLLGV